MTDEELVREWPYLTRKQVEEYKSMFDDLDVEGTGRITAEDIQVRLEQVGSFKTIKQEYVNGQLKNKYGDAFIRGNNVLYISLAK